MKIIIDESMKEGFCRLTDIALTLNPNDYFNRGSNRGQYLNIEIDLKTESIEYHPHYDWTMLNGSGGTV